MDLAKSAFLWIFLVLGVSLATLAWRPLAGAGTWADEIANGQLVLVSITITASSIGYAAMANASGPTDLLKAVVIGFGILSLVLMIGAYSTFSLRQTSDQDVGTIATRATPSGEATITPEAVETTSYMLFSSCVLVGLSSTYLIHREREPVKGN